MKALTGKWQAVGLEINTVQGWRRVITYGRGEYVWDFGPDGFVDENGGSGEFSDEFSDEFSSEFSDENGRYRIELRGDDSCFLYDLEGVEVEPDDYSIRLELKKGV